MSHVLYFLKLLSLIASHRRLATPKPLRLGHVQGWNCLEMPLGLIGALDASRQIQSSKLVCSALDFVYLCSHRQASKCSFHPYLWESHGLMPHRKHKNMLYPIGIQNFESLRKGGFTYVDKTELIYQLAATGRYYFLGRPRRFGKSLLLSTMEAYFQGKKELFKGLAIENQEKDWTEYPVLHLDWGGATYTSESIFNDKIENALRRWEQEYGIDNVLTADSVRFENIIDAAYGKTGKPVVILIDEYDKPIVDNLDREELKEAFRSRLSGFYSVMKAQDGKIRFGFLTGITKIGQLNIFSGLNNLKDISIDPRYVDLCGISEQDLHRYFDEGVQELADANNLSKEACYAKLARFYDGYHFSMKSVGIYNPFSLLSTLDAKIFTEYWYATGTPTFLTVALKQTGKDISELIANEVEVDITDLSQVDSYRVNPIPLPSGLSQPGGQERLPQDAIGAVCA